MSFAMRSPFPPISDIFLAPADPRPGSGPVSLGLRLGDGATHWADLVLPDGPERPSLQAAVYWLGARLSPALRGQQAAGLGDMAQRVRVAAGEASPAAEALATAAQWASLAALRADGRAADALRDAYGLSPVVTEPACFAEIADFAATAAGIDRLLALRPAAIGYRLTGERVAEAIGESAEHLQRFVRELTRRAAVLAPGEGYRPAVYLAFNGALGQLAGDPVRHVGKVLGHVVGLQAAAGEHQLFLEEPFLLDEPMAQAGNLHRLRDFIRRTPDSLKRARPTQLLAPGPPDPEAAALYADTAAVEGLVFDGSGGDLHHALAAVARAQAGGLAIYWRLTSAATPRQTALGLFLAATTAASAVLVSADDGDWRTALALRLLSEAAAEG